MKFQQASVTTEAKVLRRFSKFLLDSVVGVQAKGIPAADWRGRQKALIRAAERIFRALRTDFYRFDLERELRLAHLWLQVEKESSHSAIKRAKERESQLLWAATIVAARIHNGSRYKAVKQGLRSFRTLEAIKMSVSRIEKRLWQQARKNARRLQRQRGFRGFTPSVARKILREGILINLFDAFKRDEFRKRYPNRLPPVRLASVGFTQCTEEELQMLRSLL
ncbi:MAG: hypothetical protein L0Z53_14535 [Acidobacteriales bacterium]|nr:hypothetical protein [Terriglobales bacterium]